MLKVAAFCAWIVALVLTIPLITLSLEVLLGLRKFRARVLQAPQCTVCILMPAHNEAAIIGTTLDQLLRELPDGVGILVVADNCIDDTAELARARGVAVVERHDAVKRGKGFALAAGRAFLSRTPPDCVLVLDADCRTDRKSLEHLVGSAMSTGSAVQASYTLEPDLGAPPKVQISNFAFWIKNVVRQRGAGRLGAAAVLTGTGMAFPWRIFEGLTLATSNIVEDLALTVELVRKGNAPIFAESATVTSAAASERATLEQRARWEHGFLALARAWSLPTIAEGFRSRNRQLLLLGLHLCVPPLALLLAVSGSAALMLCAAAFSLNVTPVPAVLLLTLLGLAVFGVFLAWLVGGQRWLRAGSLMAAPLYVIWKMPIYVRLLSGRRAGWVRTDRTNP